LATGDVQAVESREFDAVEIRVVEAEGLTPGDWMNKGRR
jgi:hypothetical protein